MRRADEDRFRVRPGKPRKERDPGTQRFTRQVIRAAQKTGAGTSPIVRRASARGAENGRGLVAARLVGGRLGARSRRVVVKARLVVHAQAAIGSTGAHLRYIQRDSVTREGERGQLYAADRDAADGDAFERRVADDRHEFRFIVSPEDSAEIGDLRGYTRDLMARMEADLGTRLDWVAVDHWDTDNPHTHVVLRGVDDTGADLVIARDYISHGFRGRAAELATELLGPQTERELREKMTREIGQERWTGLDRELVGLARDGDLRLRDLPAGADAGFRRGLLIGRLRELERLGLAEAVEAERWSLSLTAEPTLRAMGERGDIVRTMQRALKGAPREHAIFDDRGGRSVVGRIAAKGLADELQDSGYLVIDGLDGRAHYVALPARAELADFPVGGIVEVRASAAEPRAADRTIAQQAQADGHYRAERHLAEAQRGARAGDDPAAFVEAHVRRLEALRRAGAVERIDDGSWRVPSDFLQRAAAHEASRATGAVVDLRSHLDVGKQARATGATWLDRELLSGTRPAVVGFGAEVTAALGQRQAFLEAQGLATRRGQRMILARDLLATLKDRDIAAAGGRLAAETGLEHRLVAEGDRISGTYRRSVMLASGRFAVLDDGVGFSLVPWKPVIEQRLGQSVSAVMRGGSVSWDLSRQRGIGV